VKNWTRRSKVDIFAMAHVVVVVNADGQHWVPVVIDMHAKTLTYLDSLATARANDAVPTSAMETIGHLLQYLKDEHMARHKTSLPVAWSRDNAMRGGTKGTCEQQANTNDCGVSTAMVMHSLAVQ
jgi:Ulp1 family protease